MAYIIVCILARVSTISYEYTHLKILQLVALKVAVFIQKTTENLFFIT